MADWTFEFIDSTSNKELDTEKTSSMIPDTLGSGVGEKADFKASTKSKKGFTDKFLQKASDDTIQNVIVSPLNTVTGGLASPVYGVAKGLMTGASVGAVLGSAVATIGILALQKGIEALQKRQADLETKVQSLGNADNVLIRAGSVSTATYYTSNIVGIQTKTNRS